MTAELDGGMMSSRTQVPSISLCYFQGELHPLMVKRWSHVDTAIFKEEGRRKTTVCGCLRSEKVSP